MPNCLIENRNKKSEEKPPEGILTGNGNEANDGRKDESGAVLAPVFSKVTHLAWDVSLMKNKAYPRSSWFFVGGLIFL